MQNLANTVAGKFASTLAGATALALVMGASASAQVLREPAPLMANGAPYSFADLIEDVAPAVVSLSVEANIRVNTPLEEFGIAPEGVPDFFFGDRPRGSSGSGFFVSADGYIVTNHHVVDDAREITVNLSDGRELIAELVGSDAESDLAVLKVSGEDPFPFVSFAEADDVRVGDWVVALGNPFNLGESASAGIVSAVNRNVVNRNGGRYTPFIQIDAPINPGNSGGPSFDLQGRVIGVNSQIVTRSGGSNGVGFAISARAASDIVDQLIDQGEVRRGWLGVMLQSVDEDFAEGLGLDSAKGAIVQQVIDDSPALAGGFEDGDVIVAIDGRQVADHIEATRVVGSLPAGSVAEFDIRRGGRSLTLSVTMGERDQDAAGVPAPANAEDRNALASVLGVTVQDVPASEVESLGLDLSGPAVVVSRVFPGGPAGERGLSRGAVIVEVGGEPVTSVAQLGDRIDQVIDDGRKVAILTVVERSGRRFVPVRLNLESDDE